MTHLLHILWINKNKMQLVEKLYLYHGRLLKNQPDSFDDGIISECIFSPVVAFSTSPPRVAHIYFTADENIKIWASHAHFRLVTFTTSFLGNCQSAL